MLEPDEVLRRVVAGDELSAAQMEAFIGDLMDGRVSPAMQAGVLAALATRGESVDEIAGAAAAMRRRALTVSHHRVGVVDTCGTGGDGHGTFNVSTAAALVAAGAGVPVAKHGNRSVSSRSGSADVLAALGIDVNMGPERAGAALDDIGLAFLFAPRLHPAMKAVMAVRRSLGIRTLFTVLGPLTNPASARRQVIGVFSPELVEVIARVLAELGSEHVLVVHGADGMDEISTTGPTSVAELKDGEVHRFTLEPESVGVPRTRLEALRGGEPQHNAELMVRLLEGESGPLKDIVALNAGAAIYVGGRAATLGDGVEAARTALEDGSAAGKLSALRALDGAGEGS
jgi:anthranilate phosphoribosyltransferase